MSRSRMASESSSSDEALSTGDQLCTSSVNRVLGSSGPAPTTASTAWTNSSACDWVTGTSGCSREQLCFGDRELFVGQRSRRVQFGELLDLVEVPGVRTCGCR